MTCARAHRMGDGRAMKTDRRLEYSGVSHCLCLFVGAPCPAWLGAACIAETKRIKDLDSPRFASKVLHASP